METDDWSTSHQKMSVGSQIATIPADAAILQELISLKPVISRQDGQMQAPPAEGKDLSASTDPPI